MKHDEVAQILDEVLDEAGVDPEFGFRTWKGL